MLMEGVTVRGQRVPIWNYQKGIFKPAVLGPGGAALSIQTSADSPYDDTHDEVTGRFTYRYRGTNPAHPDNAALRRAMEAQRPLLYLFAVDPGVYDPIFPIFVTADDPGQLAFTLAVDQLGFAGVSVADPLAAPRREYATRAVMQRLHQQRFRRMVLRAYADRCAICRLRHVELLDAAHILPDRDPRGEPAVTNGLGLCKIHHWAYDAHILGVDPDARVHLRVDILDEVDGPMLRHGLQAVHGTRLHLPRRRANHPNRDFLAERFARFEAA
jgi:putative restriction endonuclease